MDLAMAMDCINRIPQNDVPGNYIADTGGHMARRATEGRDSSTGVEPRKNPLAPDHQPAVTVSNSTATVGEKQVTLTLTELQNLLQSAAQKEQKSHDSQAQSQATSTRPQSTQHGAQFSAVRCDNCGKNGHPTSRCWGKHSKSQGPCQCDKSEIDCYMCGQPGHCWYECPQYK